MADVVLPQLGESVTEGTITRWFKKVGERVEKDEPLYEVSTDKVDSEVPSPVSGYLAEILVQEGETVEVGTKLAVITDSPVEVASQPPAPEEQKQEATAEKTRAAESEEKRETAPAFTGAGAKTEQPLPSSVAPTNGGTSFAASPLVRRLMREHRISPEEVLPTGRGGRITKEDVLKVVEARTQAPAGEQKKEQVASAPAPPSYERQALQREVAPPKREAFEALRFERDEVVPFSNIRKRTAEHMVRSKATSPHALVSIEADYEAVETVRKKYYEEVLREEGVKLTFLPFVARATVQALREYPHLNASVGQDALILHRQINLGIAVDLEGEGLIVPVIHNAENMTVMGLARAIADLAERARTRKLSADDVIGGTFSISNPGPWGSFMTFPIIAQPQVAILSLDGVSRKPVVVQTDTGEAIAIRSRGILGLAFDHRAVDGAYVARFLKRLTEILADTDWEREL